MCHHKISRPIQLVETSRRTRRDGLTLIELLVVVAILVALVGITATTIRPLQEGRDIREAARSVNAFLAAAQARAMELGRPVGVWLKRMPNNPNLVLELYVAEVPSPYTGDDMISSASVHETNKNIVTLKNVSRPGTGTGNEPYVNITKDDFIRFGYKGPFYRIIDYPTPSEDKPDSLEVPLNQNVLYRNGFTDMPFQIFRYGRPTTSSADPLQLPNAVAVDILMSGEGAGGQFGNGTDVAIMFSPSGGIEYMITGQPGVAPQRSTSAIHLLLGRPDQLGIGNLNDGNNRWVSIGHLTSRVTTSEVYLDPNGPTVLGARKFAVEGQTGR